MVETGLIFTAVILLIGIFATLPYRLLRFARSNCRRMDGTLSPLRTKHEIKHLVNFSAEVLLVPILAMGLGGAGLLAVHTFLIPIPLLDKVIELFDPSFARWDENMESGKYGDIGRDFGEFGEQAGYEEDSSYVLRKTLKHSWWFFALLMLAFAVFVYWFVSKYYLHIVDEYRKGVFARQTDYSRVDERRVLKG